MKFFIIVVTFLTLAACGKNHSNSSGSNTNTITPVTSADETAQIVSNSGIYEMKISPLNSKYFKFKAEGSILQDENEITISVNSSKASPLSSTTQTIYEGECPTSADDRNGDGFVDFDEARVQLVRKLIPLDADLNNSSEENASFPISGLFGKYTYKAIGNKLQIQSDLQKNYGAIKVDWEKTVVLFQGAPLKKNLPVACAKLSLK